MNDQQISQQTVKFARPIFLVVIALMLCFSFPLSVFAAVPMGILFLSYERKTAAIVLATTLLFVTLATLSGILSVALLLMFVLFTGFGFFSAEIMRRGIHPVTGVYIIGFIALAVMLLLWLGVTLSGSSLEKEIHQTVVSSMSAVKAEQGEAISKATSAEGLRLKEILENPQILTKEIMYWLPAASIVSSFLIAWVTLMLLLKNSFYWRGVVSYKYKIEELIKYKTPEYFVYPLIISLALALGSEVIGLGKTGEFIAFNVLYSLGVFYFFHGVGVYVDFLNYMKIFGFMRAFLLAMTIVLGMRMLVLVGAFDLWIDFRKFFKKKDNEGDIS